MQITQRVSIRTMISGWKVELQCDVSEDHKLIDKLCVATDLRSVLYSLDSNCQIPRRDSEGLLVLKIGQIGRNVKMKSICSLFNRSHMTSCVCECVCLCVCVLS